MEIPYSKKQLVLIDVILLMAGLSIGYTTVFFFPFPSFLILGSLRSLLYSYYFEFLYGISFLLILFIYLFHRSHLSFRKYLVSFLGSMAFGILSLTTIVLFFLLFPTFGYA